MDYKEKLKAIINSNKTPFVDIDTFLKYFPELKESEDERMIKRITLLVNGLTNEHFIRCGASFDEIKAWLEKQGKNKPADKVEPKFHEGDWVRAISSDNIFKILSVNDVLYRVLCYDGVEANYPIEVEKDLAYWTIQDAKDGDVLCTYECDEPKIVFVLKGTPKKHYALSYYCFYNIMYPHFDDGNKPGCLAPEDSDVKPATKEQRDTLMKAMTDAGYEWNTEKKGLKKIEQKPAWSEEDESMFDLTLFYLDRYVKMKDVSKCETWLKSLRERVQSQPKQEWKPSKKQMDALHDINLTGNISYAGQGQTLIELYNDLKKL